MDPEEEKYRHKVKVKSHHYIGDKTKIHEYLCQDCSRTNMSKGWSRREALNAGMAHWEAKHGQTEPE